MIRSLIQVRMGSTRLPGKALLDLAGKPLIEYVVRAAEGFSHPMLVTPTGEENKPL